MITVRKPQDIYQIEGEIQNGTFFGRWHFSFDQYRDPDYMRFGTLRVFNDDTLSPGAVWPLHPHRGIEVVTYCAEGEFRHADENGKGGILQKGWVQHTTVGSGMYHSEINNRPDVPMRFIQMWFFPSEPRLKPSVEQMPVTKKDRTNRLFPLVSSMESKDTLPIRSDAEVYSCFLENNRNVTFSPKPGWGIYLYVLEGGSIQVNEKHIDTLGAARITEEETIEVSAHSDTELLLVHVFLKT